MNHDPETPPLLEVRFAGDAASPCRVTLREDGRVAIDGIDAGSVAEDGLARVRALVSRIAGRRLGPEVGVGPRHLDIRLRGSAYRLRTDAPALDLAHADRVARAMRELFVLAAGLRRAASDGTLASFADGLPEATPSDYLLAVDGRGQRPRAYVHADGRVVFVRVDRAGETGAFVGTTRLPVDAVQEAHACAVRLLGAERPVMGVAHDPTQSLSLVVNERGAERGLDFWWGRAGATDAYLEPVIGTSAFADFHRLLELLAPLAFRPDSVSIDAWLDSPARAPAPTLDPVEEIEALSARIDKMTAELMRYDDD